MRKFCWLCDYCQKEEIPIGKIYNSTDSLPIGWIRIDEAYVVIKNEDNELDYKYAKGNDFCSQACLMQWVESPERPWNHI